MVQPVEKHPQHDFAWMAYEACGAVVLALLPITFVGSVMTSDFSQQVGHSPICQISLQMFVRASIIDPPPAWISSVGMLSAPADFPFLRDLTAVYISSRVIGWEFSLVAGGQLSIAGSPLVW